MLSNRVAIPLPMARITSALATPEIATTTAYCTGNDARRSAKKAFSRSRVPGASRSASLSIGQLRDPPSQPLDFRLAFLQHACGVERHHAGPVVGGELHACVKRVAPDQPRAERGVLARDGEVELVRQECCAGQREPRAMGREVAHHAVDRGLPRVEGDDAAIQALSSGILSTFHVSLALSTLS